MKEMKRIVALVLCLVMLVGYLPVGAQADEVAPVQEPSAITDVVVEEAAAEAEENDEESLTPDTGDPAPADEEAVSEENTTSEEETPAAGEAVEEETPAEEEATEEVTEEATEEATEEVTEEVTEEATEETVAFELELDTYVAPLLDAAGSTVVIAGSDYQHSTSGTTMKNIGAQIKEDYAAPFGILMGGDYDAGDVYPNASHLTAVDEKIESVFPSIADENRIMIQGNHETYGNLSPDKNELLDDTGAYDMGSYSVYAINYEDFGSASSGLKTYLDGKTGYTKPIFVLTHQPLHETSRGDNTKAVDIFNVLNAYEKLNIIFLFGHNHSSTYDDYLGGGAIYLKKGDSIKVAGGSTSTLNFTYMNCGYVGYSNSGADNGLTMTAFEITDSQVTVKRYDANGLHNLKSAGKTVDGYAANTDVYGQAVINLSTGESTISEISADSGDDNTGSGDNSGSTGGNGNVYTLDTDGVTTGEDYLIVSVGTDGTAQALRNNNGSVASAEVTIANGQIVTDETDIVWTYDDSKYLGNDGQYLYLTYGNSISVDANEPRAMEITSNSAGEGAYTVKREGDNYNYYLNYSNGSWTCDSSADAIYFFVRTSGTGSGGGSTVTPEGGDWVTVTAPDGGTTTYTYTQATSITAGGKYVIVGNDDAVALLAEGTTMGAQNVTITGNAGSQIMTSTTELTQWTFSGTRSGTVYNGTNYLYSSGNGYTFRIDGEDTLYFTDKGNNFVIDGASSSRQTYAFYYNGSEWATSSNNEEYVRLFQLTGTTPGGDATPGLFAKITGKLEYNVERGLTAEEVLALVQAEIKGYEYEGTSAPGDDVTGTEITDKLEFVLDSSYDGAKAGEYAVAIKYNGVTLGTAKVIVPEVAITGYDCQSSGSVKVGATGKTRTGANITVKLEDGTSYTVPVTLDMLSGDFTTETAGTYTGLTVTYNGVEVCKDFTLTVREPSSYPEYPDEGAVKVNKTGTGVQFQSTGVAQVEISASGIPMNQGVDVLLVLDTSSSMKENGGMSRSRIEILKECVNALIQNLKKERADGSVPDVALSVVDFAGYLDYKSVNYIESTAKSTTSEQLGAVLLDWTDVQNVSDTWGNGLAAKSGTNYDHGLQMGYDQLSKKQIEDNYSRKQFVLFMSDGAPFQYNGVGSSETGEGNAFEKWLLGTYTQAEVDAINTINDPGFYFESEGGAQKHRIAEAIKGSSSETFYIPSYTETNDTWAGDLVGVPGLGATMYSVGYALEEDYSRNPTGLAGMTAILKTIASVSSETGNKLYYPVTSKDDLVECFDDFAGEVLMAATNARFVDQMGEAYNLQMGKIKDLRGNAVEGVENKIEILSYDIWTRADYLANKCTIDQIGDRKGTSKVLETITFNEDGTEVYSDKASVGPNGESLDAGSNILIGGVIYAQNFWYNNNSTGVEINGVDIPTGVGSDNLTTGTSNVLPAETFYWKVGTIKTTELAMRYYVYLEGSMEGKREEGSYPTNEYAILYYNNYLNQPVGQPCHKDTVSPVMAWKAANVSYAFYLVDENGNIIVNQTTGETGSFANKIAVTNPVVYKEVLLNNTGTVESIEVASQGVLPDGYQLYDNASVYTIQIMSDATGSWTIAKDDGKSASTYVTHYDLENPTAYSNELTKSTDADFTHTVVWFAVVWKVQALPDTVVIDYGLPVDISVLSNDMFGENGKLAAVGACSDSLNLDGHDAALAAGFGAEYTGTYGTAVANANTGKVRYTPADMEMNGYDKFAYAVNYTGNKNTGFYYDTVTVIPATTIYYEDDFVDFTGYKRDNAEADYAVNPNAWTPVGEYGDKTQSEDRPGKYSLSQIDANNVYGYDPAYNSMSTYSMGSAMMAHVDANSYATATFDFYGTGFDIVGLTSNQTGVLTLKVYKYGETTTTMTKAVDTYYGYTKDAEGNWITTPDTANALYQVPVLQVEDLEYGHYTAVLTADYFSALDSTEPGGYDLYLDAVRIYDPANDGKFDTTIEDAYVADNEGWPSYIELRNHIISAADVTVTTDAAGAITVSTADGSKTINGAVFVDGAGETPAVSDYVSYGPNNELYLNPGQSVVFNLNATASTIADVQIAMKAENGAAATYKIYNTDVNGTEYNSKAGTLNSATEQYYSIKVLAAKTITLTNNGTSGILSITNIKTTYTEGTSAPAEQSMEMQTEELTGSLLSMRRPAQQEPEVEPSVPETTVPEETKPANPDKSELQAAVEEAKKLKSKDYTKESFKSMETARKAAEKVLKDKKATQEEIDKALADLNAAMDGLEAAAAKPVTPKPGVGNGFKVLESVLKIFGNFLKGNKK